MRPQVLSSWETAATLAERLRALAELLPEGGSVTLSRSALLELADGAEATGPSAGSRSSLPDVDLTVPEMAELLHRAPSTIRTWLAAGDLPGAYLFRGREWRVPRAAVHALQQREADRHTRPKRRQAPARSHDGDLGTWRQHLGRGARNL